MDAIVAWLQANVLTIGWIAGAVVSLIVLAALCFWLLGIVWRARVWAAAQRVEAHRTAAAEADAKLLSETAREKGPLVEIRRLRADLAEAQRVRDQAVDQAREWMQQLTSARGDLARAKAQLEQSDLRSGEFELEAAQAQEATDQVEALTEDLAEAKSNLKEARASAEAEHERANELAARLAESELRVSQAESAARLLQSQLDSKAREAAMAAAAVDDKTRQAAELQGNVKHLTELNEALRCEALAHRARMGS